MKQLLLSILLCLTLLLGGKTTFAFSGSGSGTWGDPYLVTSAAQLAEVADNLTAYYKQTADIALTGTWTPFGTSVTSSSDQSTDVILEAQWGLAGTGVAAPSSWVSSGTLTDAMTYANGLSSGTAYIQLLSTVATTAPLDFATGKTTILDLNGNGINRGLTAEISGGNVINVKGTLTLKDGSTTTIANQGKITGGYNGNGGGGVFVTGNFTMQGGNITGNQTTSPSQGGGGVCVDGGSFTMADGSIANNQAKNWGGGVGVYGASFTMLGGSITGNKSLNGGIYISTALTVGGTAVIDNNQTTNATPVERNVYLTNGTIKVSTTTPLTTGASIGVTTASAPISGIPVNITGNNSADYSSYFTSDNGYPVRNIYSGSAQKVMFSVDPVSTVTGISPTSGSTLGGTTVTITGTNFTGATAVKFGSTNATSFTFNSATSITATSPAGSAGTVHVTVTTLGGTSATSTADQFTYILPEAQWGLAGTDDAAPSSWVSSGTLTDAMSYANGLSSGTAYIQLLSTVATTAPLDFATGKTTILDLNGKDINRGLTAVTSGGNVITVNGTLTLKDGSTASVASQGKITGGYNSGSGGGGIYINNGSFTMQGGNITGNHATYQGQGGGGVCVSGTGSYTMTGGSIENNQALYWGGGVYVSGSFTMLGGSITGNKSANGGIYINTALTVGGTAVIDNNQTTDATPVEHNLHIRASNTIMISASTPLTTGASIGVTTETNPASSSPVNITGASSADYSSYFTSDNSSYLVRNSGSGSAQVVQLAVALFPTVTSISPTSGPTTGATSVVITGTNLTAATAVKFGSTNATSYTVNSSTQITAVSPAGSAGAPDITVTTAGGTSATSAADQFTYVGPPTVTSVTIPSNGTYKTDDVLNFTVNYNQTVTVAGGTPSIPITLNTGGTVNASYTSGSGSSALVFSYTVVAGNLDADGITVGTAITLNGATIRNGISLDAVLTLNGVPATTGVKVDAVIPTISGVTPPASGTYSSGQNLDFTATFTKAVTVVTTGGTPYITLTIGGVTKHAVYVSGSGTTNLVFRYTLASGDAGAIATSTGITTNGGTLKDSAGNSATLTFTAPTTSGITVDAVLPTISSVSPPTSGTYASGQNLDFTATFTKAVNVVTTGGSPYISITIGGVTKQAVYVSGNGTTALVFRYILASGDAGAIATGTGITLNGGTLKDSAGNNATLTFTAPTTSGITVDAVLPTISSVSPPTSGTYASGQNLDFTATFTKAVNVVTTGGSPYISITIGGVTKQAVYVSGNGTTALVFRYILVSGDAGAIATGTGITLNGGTLKDSAGNSATLTFTAPTTSGITVDAVIPTVTSVSSTSSNGTYKLGDTLPIIVSFSKNVTVTGTPTLTLNSGGTASYTSGTGTSALTFNYTVGSGQSNADLDYSATSSLALSGGTIKDATGNNAILTLPTVGGANSLGGQKDILIGIIPVVTTLAVPDITSTTATGNGNIGNLGFPNPSQYGFVWSTSTNPSIALDTKTTQGATGLTGPFSSTITGLTPNTLYHVRAYATNSAGTVYGVELSFTTLLPSITSTTYDAGLLILTCQNINSGDIINPAKFTLTGEGGATYTLTTDNVTTSSSTLVSIALNATDKAAINAIFTKNGTSSTSGTTYNLAAADDWDATITAGDISDLTGNGITVSNACNNPTAGGTIATSQAGCNPFDPTELTSTALPSGYTGTLEYKWQSSTTNSTSGFADIANSNASTYNPGSLTQTTWFKRLARVGCKSDWTGAAESNTVTITVYAIPLAPTSESNTYTYDGTSKTAIAIVGTAETINWYTTINGINSIPSLTATNAGTYSGYAETRSTATGCLSDRREITLTINKKLLTITATESAKVYGTALATGTSNNFTAEATGVGTETVTGVTLIPNAAGSSATTAAGSTYLVMPSLATGTGGFLENNYDINYVPYSGTVSKKALVITATGPSKTYGTALTTEISTANFSVQATGVGSETVTGVTLTPDAAGLFAASAAGEAYVVTPSLATGINGFVESNYSVTYIPYNGIVSRKALTITATGPTKRYGTALTSGISTTNFTAGSTGVGSETVTEVTLTTNADGLSATTPVGNAYIITPSLATGTGGFLESNYTINYVPYNGTVDKRMLTVTADAKTKTYGSANPELTFTYSGFLDGDDADDLTIKPVASTTVTTASPIGLYPGAITVSGGVDEKYDFSYIPANFSVSKITLTVTAYSKNKVYGATNPTLTLTYSGFTEGDDANDLTSKPMVQTTITTTSKAGLYTNAIIVAGGSDEKYTFNYVNGDFTIDKATLYISAGNKSKCYDGKTYEDGYSNVYKGFVNGEDQNVLNGTLTFNGTAITAKDAGNYSIIPAGLSAENYSLIYQNGTLAINALPTPFLTGSSAIGVGNSSTYTTDTSTSGYVWSVSDGGTITSGAGTRAITVLWNTTGIKTISVSTSNVSGCIGTTSINVTVNPFPTATISGDAIICAGTSTTVSISLTGKAPWNLSYTDGTTSQTVTGILESPYTFIVNPAANTTRTYTLVNITDANGYITSGTGKAVITVLPDFEKTVISTSKDAICYGSVPEKLSSTAATGGSGIFTYQWQEKISNKWVNVGTNDLVFQPDALTETTGFRLVTTDKINNNCGSVFSNEVTVTVQSKTLSGSIAADQKIAPGSKPAPIISVIAGSGDGTISYFWETSADKGLNWTTITNQNGSGYAPAIENSESWYRRITVSTDKTVCSAASDPVKITTWSTGIDETVTNKLNAYAIHTQEIRIKGQVSAKAIAYLYDIQGKLILTKKLEDADLNIIPTSNIKPGVYMLLVKDAGKSQGFKLMMME